MLSPSSSRFWSGLPSRYKHIAVLTCCAFIIITLWHLPATRDHAWKRPSEWLHKEIVEPLDPHFANSTLGFQEIIAVSGEDVTSPTSWRQNGMVGAANRTGLNIRIHQMPDFTVKEFIEFRSHGKKHPGEGSALAWMAHINVLEDIVARNISSALIFEDDVDWDVLIRNITAYDGAIATAVRNLTESHSSIEEPWGVSWDVLWLGHCGATPIDPFNRLFIEDDTLLPANQMRALWGKEYVNMGNDRRWVTYHIHATCSYAYAVTREGARKALKRLTQGGDALDNELGGACKDGDLSCVAVAPELFHQQNVKGKAGAGIIHGIQEKLKNKNDEEMAKLKEKEKEKQKQPPQHFWTMNVKYSARCNAGRQPEDLVQCLPTDEELEHTAT